MYKRIALLMILAGALSTQGQSVYEVSRVNNGINTPSSESSTTIVDDSILLYTSMGSDEPNKTYVIDFNPVLTQICQATILPDGSISEGSQNQWGLNSKGMNCANAAYDARNNILYLTRSGANEDDPHHIYYTKRVGNRWNKVQPLGGNVNLKGYTSTHPTIGYLPDGKSILYFSSDRPGGMGGMDIWYAVILKEGMPGNCTNLGSPVNSDSNEVTPFYDNEAGLLYFSSDRSGGVGGYDIYQAQGRRNSWQLPLHLGKEINSPYNDLFFTTQPCRCRCSQDSLKDGAIVEACGFFASNRTGSLYKTESNCCNDLYRWRKIKQPAPTAKQSSVIASPQALDLLPLSLYFHNDEPNPKTLDTTSTIDYTTTWNKFRQMADEYKGGQPIPVDKQKNDSLQWAIDFFFEYDVIGGHASLLQFLDLLHQDLKDGRKVCITLNGYASPLFESGYNMNLSKRRIDCIRNQMRTWNDEALLPYLNNGSLKIEQAAYGAAGIDEVSVSDPLRNPQSAKSVYSLEAALDRRVDIIDYRYF